MEDRPKILVADDDPTLTSSVGPFLEHAGFMVLIAVDGRDTIRKAASFDPDLIVLDILMPEMDGRQVLRSLRQAGCQTPIIMLTQVTATAERVQALEEGADDYINKPFDMGELLARIRAVLRRFRPIGAAMEAARKLRCGQLVLDRRARRAHLGRKELPLSSRDLAVLEHLMLRAGEMVTYDELLEAVWGKDYAVGPGALYVRVTRLRQALHDDAAQPRFIDTVSGQGYRFVGAVEPVP